MAPTETPNIAIVGAGEISRYHIDGLRHAGATVAVVVSRGDSAQRRAAEYGIPTTTSNLADLWTNLDIDAAIVATPDGTHAEIAEQLLTHDIPVMVQKPFATTAAECQQILDASHRSSTAVYTSFMHRYFHEVAETRRLLADGELGDILHIRMRNATPGAGWASWFYQRGLASGGALMQLGVHGIDLIRYMFGEIEAVRGVSARLGGERVLDTGEVVVSEFEDLVLADYRLASGTLVSHEVMYNEVAGTDRFRMEVYGSAGTALLRTERSRLALHLEADGEWVTPDITEHQLGELHHRHFLDMVTGTAPDDGSGADGARAVELAEAIYRSADTATWETTAP